MKLTPQTITGLVCIILGMVLVIGGALIKINKYSDGWLTGNNLIILGMLVELVGIFVVVSSFTKNLKK